MAGISLDFLKRIRTCLELKSAGSWLVLFFALYALPAYAQLSPGELQQSHANLEGIENCTRCHERGQQLNPQRCLNCHTVLYDRIKKNQGLHSRAEYKSCGNCHIEHQGRTTALIFWPNGQDKFDHQLTGYPLQGKHAALQCRSCHTSGHIEEIDRLRQQKIDPDRTFLGLTQECLSCHRDEHRGQLQKDCLKCHTLAGWSPATGFDHARTDFALSGLHQQVVCVKCHQRIQDSKFPGDTDFLRFTGLEYDACKRCHRDVHQNKFGNECQRCHSTSGWKNVSLTQFNHDSTDFALRGRHASVPCQQCHLPGKPLKISRYTRCSDCHSDYHQGQFASRDRQGACEECHTVAGFQPANFTVTDHQKTAYTLAGAHLAVPCNLCHKKIVNDHGGQSIQFRFASTNCQSCHTDIHQGTVAEYLNKISSQTGLSGCEYCHTVLSWKTVNYDHSQTGFTLTGRHLAVTCNRCHQPRNNENRPEQISFKSLSAQCANCHQDIHLGQFNADVSGHVPCQKCHTPADWRSLQFDHNRDSRFPLQGAHQAVACDRCHPTAITADRKYIRYKPLDSSCKTCHSQRKIQNKNN